jgi:hypothetical protein
MRISKIVSYIIYVVAFSLVCSAASQVQMALSAWSWGHSMRSVYSVSELLRHSPQHVFYAALQVAAAVLTIRQLSLRKLFYLSCFFTVISVLVTGFHHQMMTMLGGLSFSIYLIGQLLPYVAPLMILALADRGRVSRKLRSDTEKEAVHGLSETETASTNETRGKLAGLHAKRWYVFDIILIIVVLLYGTLNDPFGLIMYVCGLFNQMGIRAMMTFAWVLWMIPAALCFVVVVLRIIISWPKHMTKSFRLSMLQVLAVFGLALYSALPFIQIGPRGIDVYMKGFTKYVEANADIAAIRSWLGTLHPDDCVVYNITNLNDGTKRSSPKQLEKPEWPEAIAHTGPRYVVLSLYDEKDPQVRLNWGSGFLGSWGLVVGVETMPTPKSDLSRYGEYRKEIQKGAYIWYGIE